MLSLSPKSNPLDFDRLQLVAETDQDKASLLALFFRMGGECIAAMEQALRDGDFSAWKSAAHGLKGAAANLGMAALTTLCLDAERADALDHAQRQDLVWNVENEIERIKRYLSETYPDLMSTEV